MSGEADQKLLEKMENATVILIDIAGTSSSISFVKDTLFPYALKKSESFLNDKWEDEAVKEIVKALQEADSEVAKEGKKEELVKSLIAVVKKLTEKDSDVAAFKKLQGLIYAEGYTAGDLKGHVYSDVLPQLKQWSNGKRVCVYSTGNIESQKLLFTHSIEGDLSAHITEYFDSSIGSKTNADSYTKIATKLACKPEEVVFLTDSTEEAKAALEAKMTPVLVHREGNPEIPETSKKEFNVITSFSDLATESPKRKIEEPEEEAPPAKVAKTETEMKNVAADEQEKMEVDAEVAVEAKEEKKDETKTTNEETKTETKAECKEEKPTETETDKKVPSTEETTKTEDKQKTEAMETDSGKTEETGKPTETKETEKSNDLTEKEADNSTTTNGIDTKQETDKQTETPKEKDDKTENKAEEKTDKPENDVQVETVETSIEETKTDEPVKKEEETSDKPEKQTEEQQEEKSKETEEVNKNGNSNEKNDAEKPSTEGKENSSDLANGAHENGDSKKVVEEETDIKVKKIEAESTETAETVSVEVTA